MKNFILFAFLFTFLISCTEETPPEEPKSFAEEIIDTWSLISMTGGDPEITCDYDLGEFVWKMNAITIESTASSTAATICPITLPYFTKYTLLGSLEDGSIILDGDFEASLTLEDDILTIFGEIVLYINTGTGFETLTMKEYKFERI